MRASRWVAVGVAVGTAAGAVVAHRPASVQCPRGFYPREVRVEHQRLESDPRGGPVVVPNTWPEDMPVGAAPDRRYVVALVCVRPPSTAERHSEPYTDGGPPIGAYGTR